MISLLELDLTLMAVELTHLHIPSPTPLILQKTSTTTLNIKTPRKSAAMIAKKAFSSSKSLPSQPSILISYFSTSSAQSHQHFKSRRHQQEEDSRNVRISVWWDFENCRPPAGANAFRVAQMITAAVRANEMKGPIQITAFGDVFQLSRSNQEALSSSGINMTHVPNGGKNSADRSLLVDLMYWVSQNPPPAHLFLISGDRDFASTLHRLRMNNYNILLASVETAPSFLCSAASITWHWNELVKGENLTGKYFNQPPDGPYGSWYGHYKLPLEDPFTVAAKPSPLPPSPKVEESIDSETKMRPIPQGLKKQIRQVLSLYPEGMLISELHLVLQRRNVDIDEKFYGHMNFSSFLLAMPQDFKLQKLGDGKFLVQLVDAKDLESPDPLFSTAIDIHHNVNSLPSNSSKLEDTNSKAENVASLERKISVPEKEVQDPARAVNRKESTYPVDEKVIRKSNALETNKQTSQVRKEEHVSEHVPDKKESIRPVSEQVSKKLSSDGGVFNIIRRIWSGSSKKETEDSPEIPNNKLGGEAVNNKKLASSCYEPNVYSRLGSKSDRISEASSESLTENSASKDSTQNPGLLSRFKNWWKSKGTSVESIYKQPNEILDPRNVSALNHELYSKDSFWSEMEPFIRTQKGSLTITKSKSREEMATDLQKEGPLVLKSLKESDLILLVDILISEKKWVDECPSEASPFKVTLSFDNAAPNDDPRGRPNGLRSSFRNEALLPPSDLKSFERSIDDILKDCRNLAQEIVKEFPYGYSIRSLRKEFIHRYGYYFDVQKLGYQKLSSLLEIMPGVRVECTYIYPMESLKVPEKENGSDSGWDELGPLDGGSTESEQPSPSYEPCLSESSSSDSEDGRLASSTQPESRVKKCNASENKSSLLEILDVWYDSKNGETGNKKVDEDDADAEEEKKVVDSPSSIRGSISCGRKGESQMGYGNPGGMQRIVESYSFVEDPVVEEQHKLIDGILTSLKKTSETRMHS